MRNEFHLLILLIIQTTSLANAYTCLPCILSAEPIELPCYCELSYMFL